MLYCIRFIMEMYRSGRNENDSKSNWLFGSGFPVLLGFMRVFRLRERTFFGRSLLKFSPKFSQNARSILKFNMWSITQVVVRGRTRNPSGCFVGCLHITRGNVNFDVLTGFKACLNDAFSNNILTATIPSFKADLRYTNRKFAMKIYLEMYRSGRNENDSKSFCP